MYSYKIYDQEMTKEEYAQNKQFQEKLKSRKKEIINKLNNIIIKISCCDLEGNFRTHLLTSDGYFYKEEHNYKSYNYNTQLIGYLSPQKIDKFIVYLLKKENILERKSISADEMSIICDYNLSIKFMYNDKSYDIPDDEICSNNNVSKYKKNSFSSRVIKKMYKLVETTADLKDYRIRKELEKEYVQIINYLDMYDEKNDDIPEFLKNKN